MSFHMNYILSKNIGKKKDKIMAVNNEGKEALGKCLSYLHISLKYYFIFVYFSFTQFLASLF